MKWSRKYNLDGCKNCGRSDILHGGFGLCRTCYKNEYNDNPDRRNSEVKRVAEWNQKNKVHRQNYMKKYAQSHPEKFAASRIRYRHTENGRERTNEHAIINVQKRTARKIGVNFWIDDMTTRWFWMVDATGGYCPKCGEPFDKGKHKLSQDHIVPLTPKLGNPQGIHHINNIQVLCMGCNSSKKNNY